MASEAMTDNDALLLKRFNQRDTRAFSTVYTRFFTELHAYASRLYRNDAQLPEDAVQDVFCSLWENRGKSFDNLVKLKAFLYVTLKNRYLHHCEHLKVAERHKESLERESQFENDVFDSELSVRLQEYVERLAEPGKSVIKYYLEGYEAKDIAGKMRLSVQTVYNIKSQAIILLRKLFNVKDS